MSIRLMHLADLHLGAPFTQLGDRAEERSKDLESALGRALGLAREKNVDAVLIAGDLFDSFSPPPDLVARVQALFESAVSDRISIILIPGTHDSHRYSKCVYRREKFPGVDLLLDSGKHARKVLSGHDVYFYGFSCVGDNEQGASPFRRVPDGGIHVALVHGTVQEGSHWPAGPRDFSLGRKDIEESGFHYVALGHHHNFREFRCGDTLALYPGTLEGLKFGENGDRYLVVAEVDESRARIDKQKHNRRTVGELNIDLAKEGIESAGSLHTAIERHADPDAILKVCLMGAASFIPAADQIRERLANRFFHLEVADDTRMLDSELLRSIKEENTVRGIFVRKMLEKIEAAPAEERAAAELALRIGVEQFVRINDENQQTPA